MPIFSWKRVCLTTAPHNSIGFAFVPFKTPFEIVCGFPLPAPHHRISNNFPFKYVPTYHQSKSEPQKPQNDICSRVRKMSSPKKIKSSKYGFSPTRTTTLAEKIAIEANKWIHSKIYQPRRTWKSLSLNTGKRLHEQLFFDWIIAVCRIIAQGPYPGLRVFFSPPLLHRIQL